jgi:hypothetical protein
MTARRAVVAALAAIGLQGGARGVRAASPTDADRRGHDATLRMQRLAESWGDQSYGAVVVLGGRIVGEGPSRVVRDADPDSHAGRVAIRDALARLGTPTRAGAARMVHGAALVDAGRPVSTGRADPPPHATGSVFLQRQQSSYPAGFSSPQPPQKHGGPLRRRSASCVASTARARSRSRASAIHTCGSAASGGSSPTAPCA